MLKVSVLFSVDYSTENRPLSAEADKWLKSKNTCGSLTTIAFTVSVADGVSYICMLGSYSFVFCSAFDVEGWERGRRTVHSLLPQQVTNEDKKLPDTDPYTIAPFSKVDVAIGNRW